MSSSTNPLSFDAPSPRNPSKYPHARYISRNSDHWPTFALIIWVYLRWNFSGVLLLRKTFFISARVTFRPFKVIQGHWFWYQSKAIFNSSPVYVHVRRWNKQKTRRYYTAINWLCIGDRGSNSGSDDDCCNNIMLMAAAAPLVVVTKILFVSLGWTYTTERKYHKRGRCYVLYQCLLLPNTIGN